MQNEVGFCMQNISDTTGIFHLIFLCMIPVSVFYMNHFCFCFELGI